MNRTTLLHLTNVIECQCYIKAYYVAKNTLLKARMLFTYSRSRSSSDFFCSVGESGDGGFSLSIIVGPAASSSRWGLERDYRKKKVVEIKVMA